MSKEFDIQFFKVVSHKCASLIKSTNNFTLKVRFYLFRTCQHELWLKLRRLVTIVARRRRIRRALKRSVASVLITNSDSTTTCFCLAAELLFIVKSYCGASFILRHKFDRVKVEEKLPHVTIAIVSEMKRIRC